MGKLGDKSVLWVELGKKSKSRYWLSSGMRADM